jgi:hypothetical protein
MNGNMVNRRAYSKGNSWNGSVGERVQVPPDDPAAPSQHIRQNPMAKRRADFGFSGLAHTVLVDFTSTSPLAKEVKDYKPGRQLIWERN